MSNNIRTLEVFNTLEAFKRREYKLFRQAIGSAAIMCGTVAASTTLLPDVVALVPTIVIGVPAGVFSFKKAREADKVSNHADGIFKEHMNEIMDFKLNSMNEVEEFTKNYPTLAKNYPNLLK